MSIRLLGARALAVVALLGAMACAWAQAPGNANEQARQLAQRLGRERSVEGLETIVAARNRELLEWYERGWRDTSMKERDVPLPPAIEAIIVKNYRDPAVGATLRTLVSANWMTYRTRELFELMFEEWRSGKERPATYPIREGIFKTSLPGIEAPVLAWLAETPGPGQYDVNNIVRFLGARKYAPAVPVLARRLDALSTPESYGHIEALLAIGNPEAISVLLARLAKLRDRSGGSEERAFLASRLAGLPASARLDLDAFRAALGPGTLEDPRYRDAARLLADPAKQYQAQATQSREAELSRKRTEINTRLAEARRTRDAEPQLYVEAMQAFLTADAALAEQYRDVPSARGMGNDIGQGWLQLGNFVRFRRHDPRGALEMYEKAERAGQGMAIFAKADTWQFDLHDKGRAIAEYRRNLEKLPVAQPGDRRDEAALVEWARRWLGHQIAYLTDGRTFSGTIGREDMVGAGMLVFFGSTGVADDDMGLMALYQRLYEPGSRGTVDPAEVSRKLSSLPASGWTLMRTAGLMGQLPDARTVLAHLARNDPASYASACFFGVVELGQRVGPEGGMLSRGAGEMYGDSAALREARTRFMRERRVSYERLDPRGERLPPPVR